MNELIEAKEGKYLFQFGPIHLFGKIHSLEVSDIFGITEYINTKTGGETYGFRLLKGERITASIDFNRVGNTFVSVHFGTWGGIYFHGRPSMRMLLKWLDWIERNAVNIGVTSLKIKLPPSAVDDYRVSRNLSIFDGLGGYSEIRDYSFVSIPGTKEEFLLRLDSSNRNKLNKLARTNATSRFGSTTTFLKRCHDVIVVNRISKGLPLSIGWSRLEQILERYPKNWFGGIIELDKNDIAAGLFLKVNRSTIYVSMWGEIPEKKDLSPVVSLANELNAYCYNENIHLIDAGTATVDGVVNSGLWDFKTNLGFNETTKLTLFKSLL